MSSEIRAIVFVLALSFQPGTAIDYLLAPLAAMTLMFAVLKK